jgi:hypothetical protein
LTVKNVIINTTDVNTKFTESEEREKWYSAGKPPRMTDEAKASDSPKSGWLLARNFVPTRTVGQSLRKMSSMA